MAYVTDANKELTLQLYANPMLLQDKILTMFENHVFDGNQVLDGNNVFTFGLEMEATMVASIVNEMANQFESLYPERANTMSDLYRHMSDYDYIGIYATPATTTISLMLDRNWVIENAKALKTDSDANLITLPNYSKFTIGSHVFSIYYPINIEVRKYYTTKRVGEKTVEVLDYERSLISCRWNTDRPNPLHKLTTNIIQHRILTTRSKTWLCLEIPIYQFETAMVKADAVSSTGFLQRIDYANRFYAARVFHWLNNTWNELPVTLSDVVYNQDVATAKVKVLADLAQLEVSIPQVYFSSNLIGNKIMTLIYTTEGAMSVDIQNYSSDQFAVSFLLNDEIVDMTYSGMLKRIPSLQIVPLTTSISGGTNPWSISQIKNYVINSASSGSVIVTTNQLKEYFAELGFNLIKYIDNITDRVWLAKRELLDTTGEAIAASIYKTTIPESLLLNSTAYDSIRNIGDGKNYMIMPNAVLKLNPKTDSMEILSREDLKRMENLETYARVNELNNNTYMLTPFHIKLMTDDNLPVATVYNLFSPRIDNLVFVKNNEYTSTQIAIYGINIRHLNNGTGGYQINLTLYKTDDLLTVKPSVATPKLKRNIAAILKTRNSAGIEGYILGKYAGTNTDGRDVITFFLDTDYNIDELNNIGVSNLSILTSRDGGATQMAVPLSATWTAMFFVHTDYITNDNAKYATVAGVPTYITSQGLIFISQQELDITLGAAVPALRNNIFTTLEGQVYQTYDTTTYAQYGRDIYARYAEPTTVTYTDQQGVTHELKFNTGDLKVEVDEIDHKLLLPPPIHRTGEITLTTEVSVEPIADELGNVTNRQVTKYKGPAMTITTIENQQVANTEIIYQDIDSNAVNAAMETIYVPYYMQEIEQVYSPVVTGNSRVQIVDYLNFIIDRIKACPETPTMADVRRDFVMDETGYHFAPLGRSFAFIERAINDTATIPANQIVIDDTNQLPNYRIKPFNSSDIENLVEDYYSELDETGVLRRNRTEDDPPMYGCLYVVDPEKLDYDYTGIITSSDLYQFYNSYDANDGELNDEMLERYNLTEVEANLLLQLRFPWRKLCASGHFWCIDNYYKSRSLVNFNNQLMIGNKTGLEALKLLQETVKNTDNIEEIADQAEAIAEVNQASLIHKVVWCPNYLHTEDDSYSVNNQDDAGNFIPLIASTQSGGGALLMNDINNPNTHFVITIAGDINTACATITSISLMSGSCYLLESFAKPTLTAKDADRHVANVTAMQQLDNYEVTKRYFVPINEDLNLENNTKSDVYNWPWEMEHWLSDQGTSAYNDGIMMTLNKNDSNAKIVTERGDIVLNSTGTPVVAGSEARKLTYNLELITYDYKPTQTSNSNTDNYNTWIRNLILGYCNTVNAARGVMLERTRCYYAPVRTIGLGDFKSANGEYMTHNLEISVGFRLHVPAAVVSDAITKETIYQNILAMTRNQLATGELNCVDLANQIKTSMSDNIYYVDILGIDGDPTLQTIISSDPAICCPRLANLLKVDSNNSITLKPALNLEYMIIS